MCHPPTLRVVEFLFIVITAVYILVRVRGDTEFATTAGNDTAAPHTSDVEVTPAAVWALPGEAATKAGAGLLLFAYGSDAYTLNHFLGEAAFAAQSFKAHNPELQIAVVTNNASVDRTLFSHVLRPRPDLLFPGSPCPYEKDPAKAATCTTYQTRRQWATRLYYMALSPFELTWALDSNVVSCTPGAAGRFLSAALASELWGLDIAHSNGGGGFFPHNWNIAYRWSPRTSTLFRDWFMLQLRRGISADDQHTLFAAEQRARAASGLRVGQMPSAFAAAFYSVKAGSFFPRLTRPLQSAAHVLHCKRPDCGAWCAAFARAEVEARSRRTDARRWRARAASRSHPAGGAAAARPWQLYIPEAAYTKGQTPTPRPLFSTAACSAALQAEGVGARGGAARRAQYKGFGALAKGPKCNFREVDGEHAAAQRAFVPAGLPPVSSLRTYMAKLTW